MPQIKSNEIGLLTGGGDCPGLNAAIRAIVCKALPLGYQVRGFLKGWEGALKGKSRLLKLADVSDILAQGGTILKTSRTNPLRDPLTEKKFLQQLKKQRLKALIAIGGEDTLGVAAKIAQKGFPVIGIPKTIDNDLLGTELTIGFHTAVAVACDAIDRLHSTAESHNRVMIVEVMGRHAGWIATRAGIAGGADLVLIPERPFQLEQVFKLIKKRHKKGKDFSIIVVAEGARIQQGKRQGLVVASHETDDFGHVTLGGVGSALAKAIAEQTGFDARAVVLGHLQRGGTPTPFDRVLASQFGIRAVELVEKKKFGRLVARRQGKITDVALSQVTKGIKKVPRDLYNVAETFFG